MSKAQSQKLSLAAHETIPLDKLEIHEDNVRKPAGDDTAIADLAADIAARGLLQSVSVRPILDDAGQETGRYGIQAGSRRFRALKLLVKQKKLTKNAPVPCLVKTDGFAEADSLAENTQRQALKPLDEFRAFKALSDKGHGEETIAAAFRVSTLVVRQRLANASPNILKAYERDEITIEQLMAYCLTGNHARQEQVFEALASYWNKGPDQIKRLLTEKSIPADDKRARFIGMEAYLAAGGPVERDLFSEAEEGYLADPDLLNRLVTEKLGLAAGGVRGEGWAWVEHAIDFPWNHRRECRAIAPVTPALNEDESAEYDSLSQELDEYEGIREDDHSEEDRKRIAEIEAELAGYYARAAVYSDEQKAKAGAFVSLDHDGTLLIERGYRRYADLVAEQRKAGAEEHPPAHNVSGVYERESDDTGARYETGEPGAPAPDDDNADLPDKLLTELTAYHSLGLRNSLADNHCTAYLAVLHALTLRLFYRNSTESCLQIEARDTLVPAFPGLGEFKAAQAIAARHDAFQKLLPGQESALWDFLRTLNEDKQRELFAHCVGLTVNALHEAFARSNKRRHALQLGEAVNLDMGVQGFVTRAENYLGRITKQQILDTIAEAKGQDTADLLAGLKKKEMAAEAERLLADTGWLPEPLRTPAALEPEESEATRFRPSSRMTPKCCKRRNDAHAAQEEEKPPKKAESGA
jgi:ParB family transcriptional regulator, chromosome partitioning protein